MEKDKVMVAVDPTIGPKSVDEALQLAMLHADRITKTPGPKGVEHSVVELLAELNVQLAAIREVLTKLAERAQL